VVVTGGSRGIGLAIAVRCALDGANVAILAKTVTDQPTLPGITLIIKELFLQQLMTSKKQAEKPYPSLAISEMKQKSKNASQR
jgi:NAD(P)-dependent dehydrogenase (short-subunit alcohol dehydrogenase family)